MAVHDDETKTSCDDLVSHGNRLNVPPTPADARSMVAGVPKSAESLSSSSSDMKSSKNFTSLPPSNPQEVIDFFNTPGEDNYLFVRMLEYPFFEADVLLGKAKKTPPKNSINNYWRSATAIKKDVPFCVYRDGVGFLFSQKTSVGKTTKATENRPAWGKKNLFSLTYSGLNSRDEIGVTPHLASFLEKNPIGEKLEEIRKRMSGQWPDMTTKELYAFLYGIKDLPDKQRKTEIKRLAPCITDYDLSKLASLISEKDIEKGIRVLAPGITDADLKRFIDLRKKLESGTAYERENLDKPVTRYSLGGLFQNNEVLIHPTVENMLGIVCMNKVYIMEVKKVKKHFEENGGPHLPIFRYVLGELTEVTDDELQKFLEAEIS